MTGATSGIGEKFAHYLASKNMSILLVSRTESKLKTVAADISKAYPSVSTSILAYDFGTSSTSTTSTFYKTLSSTLATLATDGGIGVLINNVGLANEDPELTHLIPSHDVEQMLSVNNAGTIRMTQAVLPHMMVKKSGAVICVSSASCTHPTPMLSVYSATKAFGNQLTRSMYYEYKEHGIDCLSITPYYFVSNMFKRRKATYLAPFPEAIIDSSMPLLGHCASAHPYWFHTLMGMVADNYYDTGTGLLTIMKRNKARALAKAAAKKNKAE